jgi:hypothetical protein
MDIPPYMSHGQQSIDDDGASSTGGSNKDKGRGSYKCGRVGSSLNSFLYVSFFILSAWLTVFRYVIIASAEFQKRDTCARTNLN